MEKLTFVVPTLLGVEGLTADELRRMGMAETRAENGRVLCQGEAKDIPRLNLRLRTGERVLLLVGSFPARSFEELFQGVQALPWERWIPQGGQFPVKGYSLNSVLHSVPACQSIVKKAVATRLGRVYHRETLPEDGALYQIQFSLMKNQASLMLDTTGPGLYKRGYRAVGVEAPLRETLAAALVLLSGYRGKDPFCDPFCGSGTIAIEAALIAKNRAPGLNRTFSAQKWDWLPSQTWVDGAGEAMDLEYDGTYDIWGGDIDPAAVHLAQANAVKADVEDLVPFTQGDAGGCSGAVPDGWMVCQRGGGGRWLGRRVAAQLYRDFGRAVRGLPKGWRVSVLSAHPAFERAFGAPADKKRKLYNGMLQCNLYQYGKKPGVSPKQKAN